MKSLLNKLLSNVVILCFLAYCSCSGEEYQVNSSGLTVSLSQNGEIKFLSAKGKKIHKQVHAFTGITGCRQEGQTIVIKTNEGGFSFERTLVHDSLQQSCIMIDKYIPTSSGIRWELSVEGTGEPWSAPIYTHIQYPTGKNTLFWTAWGMPKYNPTTIDESMEKRLKPYRTAGRMRFLNENNNFWVDPLVPVPFSNVEYDYGAPYFKYHTGMLSPDGVPYFNPAEADIFCIPIATVIEPAKGAGLTFALSPEDTIIGLTMKTSAQGEIVFSRLFNRISSGLTWCFSMDIMAHDDDWRPALAWVSARYPEYFNPKNPEAHILGGTGAYSNHFTEFDKEKMKKMCFTVNWQSSFDFPYMGMYLPPVDRNVEWDRFIRGGTMSIQFMSDYASEMKKLGFYVLNYFNVTEFGNRVQYPPLPRSTENDNDLWKHNNDYLYVKLPGAILPRPVNLTKPEFVGARPPEPWFSWARTVVMDPGEERYRIFLLDQAQRHVNEIPDSYGICIDRLDWLRMFNERADDGISWFDGKPVRSLLTSWKNLMGDMGPVFHKAGKSIFVNQHHLKRVDILNHVDGLFDEFGYAGIQLNTTAMLGINKPAIAWTDAAATVNDEGGDSFFQKYLYMGVFPMCPFPGNDHSIGPDPEVDRYYLDYGPLMKLMQSKQWVLEPHAVSAENYLAKVNMFQIPDGYSIPVVYGKSEKVCVKIANVGGLNKKTICTAYHPGKETPIELTMSKKGNFWYVDVPLERGCAMLKLTN